MYLTFFILTLFTLIYAMISKRLDRTVVTGPMLFVGIGVFLGPQGVNLIVQGENSELLKILAEFTLALVLFSDASSSKLKVIEKNIDLPRRLLLLGLPLTMILGFALALLIFPELSPVEAALLAIILAPTDAALGKAVVTNPLVPAKLRESLGFESGLNDGICVPFLLLALAFTHSSETLSASLILYMLKAIGIGTLVGLSISYGASVILIRVENAGWISKSWERMIVIVLAFSIFTLAELLGGSGFIAAFTGGLLFGKRMKSLKERYLLAAEGFGDSLALFTWTIFGAALVSKLFESFSWPIILYAILSLTVIRMLPVFLSLAGTRTSFRERLFAGWFGPRGLASIVFIVIAMESAPSQNYLLVLVVCCTILLSIIAHGISANPLVSRLSRQ